MKIAILTLFTEKIADYGAISTADMQACGRRHGYNCLVFRERRASPSSSALHVGFGSLPDFGAVEDATPP